VDFSDVSAKKIAVGVAGLVLAVVLAVPAHTTGEHEWGWTIFRKCGHAMKCTSLEEVSRPLHRAEVGVGISPEEAAYDWLEANNQRLKGCFKSRDAETVGVMILTKALIVPWVVVLPERADTTTTQSCISDYIEAEGHDGLDRIDGWPFQLSRDGVAWPCQSRPGCGPAPVRASTSTTN